MALVAGEVESVTVPGVEGEFQMLNNHAPIVSVLQEGKVKFQGNPKIAEGFEKKFTKQADGKWAMDITGGMVECYKNRIIVLVD